MLAQRALCRRIVVTDLAAQVWDLRVGIECVAEDGVLDGLHVVACA